MSSKGRMDNSGMDNKNNRIWKIACVALVAAGLICTAVACAGKAEEEGAEDTYRQLAEQTSTVPVATEEPAESTAQPTEEPPAGEGPLDALEALGVPVPDKEVDFGSLQADVNKDIYAWIYIPDTQIDYPMLQHPTDNTYYLNHNLDGSKGYPGCIYTEDYNGKDFKDPNTVVYGHNMKNGSMFAGLHQYGDSEYMESHPYVYIYTEEGLLAYEVFAAYESSDEHILYEHDGFGEAATFESYLKEIKGIRAMGSVVREDVEVTADSRILTLSTCISGKPRNRFLVQGVLLDGGALQDGE